MNQQLVQIDTAAPTATISCNAGPCGSGVFANTVSITMSGADQGGSGVAQIIYTTDGSTPTLSNGRSFIGAFSVNTSSLSATSLSTTRATSASVGTQQVQVDAAPPSSTITCDGGACSGTHTAPVTIGLSAADNVGGSGVASIRYTTDGSIPTAGSGGVYTSPFDVNQTTTVNYLAIDNAGNAETFNTQVVTIGTPASVTVTTPSDGAVLAGSVTLAASVTSMTPDHVDFYVGATKVGTANATPWSIGWDSTTAADGPYAVVAKAVQGSTTITSPSVSVSVKNTQDPPPTRPRRPRP